MLIETEKKKKDIKNIWFSPVEALLMPCLAALFYKDFNHRCLDSTCFLY